MRLTSPTILLCVQRRVQAHIESTKTTSMEDVSTGVFEKIKNIYEVKIKPKNDMYQDIYNCKCQNTKNKLRYTIQ